MCNHGPKGVSLPGKVGAWGHGMERTSVDNVDPSQVQVSQSRAPAPDVMAALCQGVAKQNPLRSGRDVRHASHGDRWFS